MPGGRLERRGGEPTSLIAGLRSSSASRAGSHRPCGSGRRRRRCAAALGRRLPGSRSISSIICRPIAMPSSTRARLMASLLALGRQGLDAVLRAVAHEARRHPQDALDRLAVPGEGGEQGHVLRRRARSAASRLSGRVPRRHRAPERGSRPPAPRRPRPRRRASPAAATPASSGTPVSSSTTCCASSSVIVGSLRRRARLLDARLGAAALVGVLQVHRAPLRALAPLELAAVVGDLFGQRRPRRGRSARASRGRCAPGRVSPQTPQRTASGSLAATPQLLQIATGWRSASSSAMRSASWNVMSSRLLRHEAVHRLVDHRVGDHAVALLQRQAQDAGARDALDLRRHAQSCAPPPRAST